MEAEIVIQCSNPDFVFIGSLGVGRAKETSGSQYFGLGKYWGCVTGNKLFFVSLMRFIIFKPCSSISLFQREALAAVIQLQRRLVSSYNIIIMITLLSTL